MSGIATDNQPDLQYWENLLETLFSDEGVRWLILKNYSREYSANYVDVR